MDVGFDSSGDYQSDILNTPRKRNVGIPLLAALNRMRMQAMRYVQMPLAEEILGLIGKARNELHQLVRLVVLLDAIQPSEACPSTKLVYRASHSIGRGR